jgi:UvrD-like helicase family protein
LSRAKDDIGFVADVEPEERELAASFDGRSVTYGFGELDALVPAYAASIHKSQGSEYPAVVIPVMTQHHAMLQRNLLYTGVTRGKAARRSGWPEEGRCHRGAQRLGPAAEADASISSNVASARPAARIKPSAEAMCSRST